MNKYKSIKTIIGLINILLRMQEDMTIFVNGKALPECWQCFCDENYVIFCLMEETNIDCGGLCRIHYGIDSINEITIMKEGEII